MRQTGISTHVLDTANGLPAVGVKVVLEVRSDAGWRELARGITDADGRVANLLPDGPPADGEYRIRFDTAAYFAATGTLTIYPEVAVQVRLEAGGKYHLPLLLSPFGYSTYRGS